MYGGGSNKFTRGGGRGGGSSAAKRGVFPPPPPPQRRTSSSGRLSLGGSDHRGRNPSSSSAPVPESQSEETFSLVGGNPLSFASIIRLAPDLIDEIKRVEAQGGAVRIKFDANPDHPFGNVIDVGGKEFRFTWSHETGGLCDIYEERESGEDGNGLLVESGCACRKLNVQRVLDESTKNHVKMRSEEAERKLKARKAIILDPCNPSMKSQMKQLAAAEASPWKYKHKKDSQFKKKTFEPPQGRKVGGPSKPVHKSGFPSIVNNAKGRSSTSPLPSPQNQSLSVASPSVRGNATESQTIAEDSVTIQVKTKEKALGTEKDFPAHTSVKMQEVAVHRDNQVAGVMDLENSLITLLKDNPRGMSIKALEKAVGDMIPNSGHKIEPILKKIATYKPPGGYILRPGVQLESLKRPSFDSGSSPEDSLQKQSVEEDNNGGKSPTENLEDQASLNNKFEQESNLVEKIDASLHFSELFGDDDPPDNSEGKAASSSKSGSDSDSDSGSSDSGGRSPARSPSGSSSDTESDSSSSKDGSDVDIDIISDNDKEPKNFQDSGHGLSAGPADGDQDGYASDDVEIDILNDNDAELATAPHVPSGDKLRPVSPDHEPREGEHGEDEFKHDSGVKSKRGSKGLQFEENVDHVKRPKAGSNVQSSISGHVGSHILGSPSKFSPDLNNEDHYENNNLQMSNRLNGVDNANLGMQRGSNYLVPGKSTSESLQSGRRQPTRSHDIETVDKPVKNPLNWELDVRYQDANAHAHEEGSSIEKINGKFKENPIDQKNSVHPEPHYKKNSERGRKSNVVENSARLQIGSPKDNGKTDFDRSPFERRRLQRELSELELGELREPLPEGPEMTKRKFERVGSFKQSETKLVTSSSRSADLTGKPASKPSTSSPNLKAGFSKNSGSSSKRSPEPFAEDTIRSSHRAVQSQPQQVGSVSNKEVDPNRLRHNEAVANQGTDVEGYGETQKKSHGSTQLEDSKHEIVSHKGKGNKLRKSSTLADASDRRRDVTSKGRNDKRKRSESSTDENSSYSKYEKEEPELKGPIKSFSQYKEYVQEYREKYESYCSLNKILESYRNEFQKLGMDLDSAKGRDMERYNNILALLRESYRQCGARHKRLKKIFIVLHEELKHLKQRIKDFAADFMKD